MKLSKQSLLDKNPCAAGLAYAATKDFDCAKIYDACDRGDWMVWLLSKSEAINKKQAVLIACASAEHVLNFFEKKHPDDHRP